MLFRQRFLDGIKAGAITRAFRRWRRPTVKTGGTLKTPVGVLAIDSVSETSLDRLTAKDAKSAGFDSLDDLLADLRSQREGTVYRIELRYHGADPRIELRERPLSKDELGALIDKLRRMDERSAHGPWTRQVLELLRDNEGVRAGDLAPKLKRETLDFKRDVRKLKNLGLTESLGTGYRISPRGKAVLKAMR